MNRARVLDIKRAAGTLRGDELDELRRLALGEGARRLLLTGEISVNTARLIIDLAPHVESLASLPPLEPFRILRQRATNAIADESSPGYRNVGKSLWLDESTGKFFFTMHGDASSSFAGPYDTIEQAREEFHGLMTGEADYIFSRELPRFS